MPAGMDCSFVRASLRELPRFDMNTTNEQRKQTLENLLADEDRFKVATNRVPELKEINQLIARSPEEEQLFNSLDETESWPYDPMMECPSWMLFDDDDVMAALKTTSRHHMKKELKKREAAGWTRIHKVHLIPADWWTLTCNCATIARAEA